MSILISVFLVCGVVNKDGSILPAWRWTNPLRPSGCLHHNGTTVGVGAPSTAGMSVPPAQPMTYCLVQSVSRPCQPETWAPTTESDSDSELEPDSELELPASEIIRTCLSIAQKRRTVLQRCLMMLFSRSGVKQILLSNGWAFLLSQSNQVLVELMHLSNWY